MSYRWNIAPPNPLLVQPLVHGHRLTHLTAQCLVNRGLHDPVAVGRYLEPRLKDLGDPDLLPGMTAAVARLLAARHNQEEVILFGDYDVDGVTSTTLMADSLSELGWRVHTYLPHRIDEGYGLTQAAVEKCLTEHPATLMVALDCGTTAVAPIAWLKDHGCETIVVDHHQLEATRPDAAALVNPLASGSPDPEARECCTVGLAFKLLHSLVKAGRREIGEPFASFDIRRFLDLVAVGTVADLVPLVRENRILVSAGLVRLNETRRPGLLALKTVAHSPPDIEVPDISFQLAPRLNAAGRLETASAALQLLRARDLREAEPLAQLLDSQNRERQAIERQIAEEALGAIRTRFQPEHDFVIVEGRLHWHVGVVGIVASRILREFHRPTIVLGGETQAWRGSGRSIPGFDLAAALRGCSHLLLRHGGHAMAAGVTVLPDQVPALSEHLNRIARLQLTPDLLRPELRLDAEVSLSDLSLDAVGELSKLAPFGQHNPEVHVAVRSVRVIGTPRRLGREQQHLRFRVGDQDAEADVIWWQAGPDARLPTGPFDLAACPSVNEYNGRRDVQLKYLDARPA